MAVESSFPDVTSTGPIHFFARTPVAANYATPGTAKIWYLGTCTTKPQLRIDQKYLDVFNDLRGRKTPFQKLRAGSIGVLAMAMNRVSLLAYNAILTAGGIDANASGTGVGPGFEGALDQGDVVFGKHSVEVWALYSFYNTLNDPNNRLPKGRYFPCAVLEAHEILRSGTEDLEVMLGFSVNGLYGGVSGAKARGFTVYSEASADFPADIALANVQ